MSIDLLAPRFKVLIDYPNSYYKVGSILKQQVSHEPSYEFISKSMAEKYPAIFHPLEWYEDRKPEDLPKYLKYKYENIDPTFYKVNAWDIQAKELRAFVDNNKTFRMCAEAFPATEKDYLEYINQSTIKI